MNLLTYKKNVYSQNGEDGILGEILNRIGVQTNQSCWCVEFGAWDGKHLSNTYNLVHSAGWNAVYIEGDPEKFDNLRATALTNDRIHAILAMVKGPKGNGNALDDLLTDTGIPLKYDLLSIDIDSSDLDVWVRSTNYEPKIVVIEINSTIEPGILQWHSEGAPGNSFSSTVEVARSKGYTLVCHTGNLIFVKDEYVSFLELEDLDVLYPERLFSWYAVQRPRQHSIWERMRVASSRLPASIKSPVKKALNR